MLLSISSLSSPHLQYHDQESLPINRHCGLCLYFRALIFTSLVQLAIQCKNSSHYAKLHLLAKKHFFLSISSRMVCHRKHTSSKTEDCLWPVTQEPDLEYKAPCGARLFLTAIYKMLQGLEKLALGLLLLESLGFFFHYFIKNKEAGCYDLSVAVIHRWPFNGN